MYIITTKYLVDPKLAEPHKQTHKDWVEKYVARGTFRFAGPRADQSGGVIVAADIDEGELERILAEDSYVQARLINMEINRFDALFAAP